MLLKVKVSGTFQEPVSVPGQGCAKQKADVAKHPEVFGHVGLLIDRPPGKVGLPFAQSSEFKLNYPANPIHNSPSPQWQRSLRVRWWKASNMIVFVEKPKMGFLLFTRNRSRKFGVFET